MLFTILGFCALFLGVWLQLRQRNPAWGAVRLVDPFFYIALGGAVGASLGYALPYLVQRAMGSAAPAGWWSGQNWLGALAGGGVAGVLYCRARRLPLGRAADLFAPVLPLAQTVGRIGCLMNGDAYGRPTSAWVGMVLPDVSGTWTRRYPTQLADLLADVCIAALLFTFIHYTGKQIGKLPGGLQEGGWFALYLGLYCGQRFCFEFWRGDLAMLWGPFTWTQLYCLAGIAVAAGIASHRPRRNSLLEEAR